MTESPTTTKTATPRRQMSLWQPLPPMPIGNASWTLRNLADHYKRALIFPSYQRNYVWDVPRQRELIDTVLNGWPVPPIEAIFDESDNTYEISDGQQRLRTFLRFMNNDFKTLPFIDPEGLLVFGPRFYSELPDVWKGYFDSSTLMVRTIKATPNMPKERIFRKYQNGMQLNRNERRHANRSQFGFAVHQLGRDPVWLSVYTDTFVNRHNHLPAVAAALLLEAHGVNATLLDANINAHLDGKHDRGQPWLEVAAHATERLDRHADLLQGNHANWSAVEMVLCFGAMVAYGDQPMLGHQTPAGILAEWADGIVGPWVEIPKQTRGTLLKALQRPGGLAEMVGATRGALEELSNKATG